MGSSFDGGAVISRTFSIYSEQASVLLPAAAVVYVIEGVLSRVLIAASPALALLSFVLTIIASTLFTGMVVELVADLQDGRLDASAGDLLRAAMPVLGQLILVGILAGFGILIGLILLVIPGLILITIWSVAAPVVVLERPGAMRALGRSRELVRGNGWQVFGVIVVLVILVAILAAVLDAVGSAAGTGVGIVVAVVVGVLTAPIQALAQAVLYFELGGSSSRGAGAQALGGGGDESPDPFGSD